MLCNCSIASAKPHIANLAFAEVFDQGSQFTGAAFTGVLIKNGDRDQHGRQGRLARQHLRRAAVAQHPPHSAAARRSGQLLFVRGLDE